MPKKAETAIPVSGAEPERRLNFDPPGWLYATWRTRVPRVRPEPQPFSLERALRQVDKVLKESHWSIAWERAGIADALSPEESQFWLTLMLQYSDLEDLKVKFNDLKKFRPKPINIREQWDNLYINSTKIPPEIMTVLAGLYDLNTIIDLMFIDALPFTAPKGWESRFPGLAQTAGKTAEFALRKKFSDGFRRFVVPSLTVDEFIRVRERVHAEWAKSEWKGPQTSLETPFALWLASVVGLPRDVEEQLDAWLDYKSDDDPHGVRQLDYARELIYGLSDPAQVERIMRQRKIHLYSAEGMRGWLEHTAYLALDWIVESMLSGPYAREDLLPLFTRIEAPEVAPHMLKIMLWDKPPREARKWLLEHPLHSIVGLMPLTTGEGDEAAAAIGILKSLKHQGHEEYMRARLEHVAPEVAARVLSTVLDVAETSHEPLTQEFVPESLRAALATGFKKKPASWVRPGELPPLLVNGRQLTTTQVDALFKALQASTLQEPHALVKAMRELADRPTMEVFLWSLYDLWLLSGAPATERWVMTALGTLGDDNTALKLTRLIRAWPGESQHARAVVGLECLRAIGSDIALMQISGIAQKLSFKALKAKAVEMMEAIASDRGLTRAQLEDRVVPDCGLDERGSRIFDFGPRQFSFVLGPAMKPMVREAASNSGEAKPGESKLGKPKPDLPKPNSKDDAALADEAVREWKLLKKQIAQTAKIQAVRLEQAMVTGRQWTPGEFELLLVRQPLMTNLTRLLLWEGISESGRRTFRVTEDLTCADANDEECSLEELSQIRVAHPLNMTDAEKSAWGELFADYELAPPFPQLGRMTYALEGGELEATVIARFKDTVVPPQSLCFGLENLGWERGAALDGGGFYEHVKPFEEAGVTAVVVYEPGLSMGYTEGWEPQKVTECYFVPGLYSSRNTWDYPSSASAVPLGTVHPIAMSEVLKDLHGIAAKGQVHV